MPENHSPNPTRRAFLAAAGAVAAVAVVGCGSGDTFTPIPTVDQTKAWRLSTRDVASASNAAKLHAANWRFLSGTVADGCRAHPGDRSNIVPIDISPRTWQLWFGGGATKVDLRKI